MAAWPSGLVGRRDELAALDRALAGADAGAARAVALRGEPGIGKSRLLAELAGRAAERGLLVLEGRAAELERELTFALLIDAFEPLAGEASFREAVAALDDWQRAELGAWLPGAVAQGAPPASGERHRAARAVRALLERLARDRPLALLLDDVHWADPASADVVSLLLHRPPRGGVLLALAARTRRAPQLEAALAAAEQAGGAAVLELRPLPADLVGELLPGARPATRERLYRESGGNPFYLQELLRAGDAPTRDGAPRLVGVPATVQAALAGEVAALPPGARLALEGAAVAGDPFEPDLAAAAADVAESAALDALDELLAAELVRVTGDPRRFRFRHPLVRRAVYEGAGGGWRLAAHARVAAALAARGASPARRAHHVERAARPGELPAVDVLAAAADEVVQVAPATAAGWYAAALRLLPETAEHRERRLALLRAQAGALASVGRAGDARDALRRVLGLLPADAGAERVATVVRLAGIEAVWTQQPDAARRLLEAERAALGDGSPQLHAALDMALAEERAEWGDHVACEMLADRAREAARAAGDRVLEAAAAGRAADAAHCRLRGDDPAALAAADAKIAAAGALIESLPDGEVAQSLSMLLSLGIARGFTGDLEGAYALAERGLALARRTGQGLFAPAFTSVRALAELDLGRLDAAEADLDEARESALLSGNVQVSYWSAIGGSTSALQRGNVDLALTYGRQARELLGTRPYSQAGFSLADAHLAAGDPAGALEALEAFGWVRPELWTFDRLRGAEIAVRVLLALGRVEEAEAWARRMPAEGGGRRSGLFGATIALAQSAVLLAQGAAQEAARVAAAGAAEAAGVPAPVWGARCRIVAGEALLAAGQPDGARAELRAAVAELERCGAWWHRDAAVRLLRRLGERPRPPAAAGSADERLAALTAREREVAALVAEGCTNAQVAARLQLSESTVEKHVSRVLAKLGLPTRAGVVRLLASKRA